MKKSRWIVVFIAVYSVANCGQRLDSNLFNPNTEIEKYQWDSYQGAFSIRIDNDGTDLITSVDYEIPDSAMTELTLQTADRLRIKAVYIGEVGNIDTDMVIMYCHGNRDHMDHYWTRAKLLANVGGINNYGVMMIDYRGYGLSEGEPSEEGLYIDVDTALQWLKKQGLSNDRLIIYGYSLGTAPAIALTANPRSMEPARIIIESPFASAEMMVQESTGLVLPGIYVTDLELNNAEEIKNVPPSLPLLWIHGVEDAFLDIDNHGEVVYKNHPGKDGVDKFAVRVDGADHTSVPEVMTFPKYTTLINDFITGGL